jgi:hypothetical protein
MEEEREVTMAESAGEAATREAAIEEKTEAPETAITAATTMAGDTTAQAGKEAEEVAAGEVQSQPAPVEAAVDAGLHQEQGQGQMTLGGPEEDTYGVEAEAVRRVYPTFDLAHEMQDPVFRALLRGEICPTLRQVYEVCHREALTAEAVSQAEAQLVSHIQARGQRPAENGMADRGAVRMHPDVGRLTRSDRAELAHRAQEGESIRL